MLLCVSILRLVDTMVAWPITIDKLSSQTKDEGKEHSSNVFSFLGIQICMFQESSVVSLSHQSLVGFPSPLHLRVSHYVTLQSLRVHSTPNLQGVFSILLCAAIDATPYFQIMKRSSCHQLLRSLASAV